MRTNRGKPNCSTAVMPSHPWTWHWGCKPSKPSALSNKASNAIDENMQNSASHAAAARKAGPDVGQNGTNIVLQIATATPQTCRLIRLHGLQDH